MFSPHKGDALLGLPDSCSLKVVWETAGERTVDRTLICSSRWVLGEASTFGFGAVWDQKKKWASCWLKWSAVPPPETSYCSIMEWRQARSRGSMSATSRTPFPIHEMAGVECCMPLLQLCLLVAGPLARNEHFNGPLGLLPSSSSAGDLNCWDQFFCHGSIQAHCTYLKWQHQAWDAEKHHRKLSSFLSYPADKHRRQAYIPSTWIWDRSHMQ